jgi:hypothetical protein
MLEIAKNIPIDFDLEKQLQYSPRLLLNDTKMLLTDSNSIEDLYNDLSKTIGSSEDWLPLDKVDTLAFDSATKLLKILFLYYSEENKIPKKISLLDSCQKITGIPRLRSNILDFNCVPFLYRHYDIERNLLVCFDDNFSDAETLTQYQIANNVCLFFRNEDYCAWGLYNPELYLTMNITNIPDHSSTEFLKKSFRRAFDLITNKTVERMDEKDLSVLKAIAELHNEIICHSEYSCNKGLSVIKSWLYDVTDRFYSEKEIQLFF